jgi:hydroxymethylbilane synthase
MAQIRRLRPDAQVESLRGNLDTRLRKLDEGAYDAIILAAAGLHRMGWRDRISAYLDPESFVPAIGQGALGLEIRRDDERLQEIVSLLHDSDTAIALEAERAFLAELEGGCQVPIGGHARVMGGEVELTGVVCSLDGALLYRESRRAPIGEAGALGRELARALLDAGAGAVLEEIYGKAHPAREPDIHTR